jgi:hypothetical protein
MKKFPIRFPIYTLYSASPAHQLMAVCVDGDNSLPLFRFLEHAELYAEQSQMALECLKISTPEELCHLLEPLRATHETGSVVWDVTQRTYDFNLESIDKIIAEVCDR